MPRPVVVRKARRAKYLLLWDYPTETLLGLGWFLVLVDTVFTSLPSPVYIDSPPAAAPVSTRVRAPSPQLRGGAPEEGEREEKAPEERAHSPRAPEERAPAERAREPAERAREPAERELAEREREPAERERELAEREREPAERAPAERAPEERRETRQEVPWQPAQREERPTEAPRHRGYAVGSSPAPWASAVGDVPSYAPAYPAPPAGESGTTSGPALVSPTRDRSSENSLKAATQPGGPVAPDGRVATFTISSASEGSVHVSTSYEVRAPNWYPDGNDTCRLESLLTETPQFDDCPPGEGCTLLGYAETTLRGSLQTPRSEIKPVRGWQTVSRVLPLKMGLNTFYLLGRTDCRGAIWGAITLRPLRIE